jgi:hypothetical protein
MVGIKPNWLAYQFDGAVMIYGRYVDNESKRVKKDGKPERSLSDIIEFGERPKRGSLEMLVAMFGID